MSMKRVRKRLRAALDVVLAVGLVAALVVTARWSRDTFDPPERIGASPGGIRVIDGDSLVVAGREIRLLGIDAPERDQDCRDADGESWPCGRAAQAALARLAGSELDCESRSQDRYLRAVARCRNAADEDIGAALVRAGWAVILPRYAPAGYRDLEDEAREAERGIWRGEFERPAAWRAAQRAS